MPDKLLQLIPFFATTSDNHRPKLNTARLLEICITLGAVYWGMSIAMAKLEVKMDSVEKHVAILDDRIYEHMQKDDR